jgi:hypothetical protein
MTGKSLLRSPTLWLLLGVFALEFFLFDHFGARRHTPFYPRWDDQVQYLTESYTGYEYAQARGFGRGLVHALINPSAQGTLHDFFAIIAFKFAGASRSATLALNLLALIGWQMGLFLAVARASGSQVLAFAAALLPLALRGPWEPIPGSAYDFRLDHAAMCGLGVCAALAVLTEGFRSPRMSTCFGIAVGLTILGRFLTGAYFALIFLAFLGWIACGADRKLRLANLARAAFATFVLAAPILWLNRDMIQDYYWVGHYVGPESALRNQHMGLGRSLAFVWSHLAQRHLGWLAGMLAVGGTTALALLRGGALESKARATAFVGAVFFLAPILILTLHPQKSEVVVGALAPGLLFLVAAAWMQAARSAGHRSLIVFAGVTTAIVLTFFTRAQLSPAYSPAEQQDLRRVNALADEIFQRARAGKLKEPRVAVDYITDSLDARVLRVICYERHHVLLPINMTLPTGVAEPDEATVLRRMQESDFVFLTDEAPAGIFPYDRKLAALRPKLRAWCEANLRGVNQFTLFGRRMLLYQRREIPFP